MENVSISKGEKLHRMIWDNNYSFDDCAKACWDDPSLLKSHRLWYDNEMKKVKKMKDKCLESIDKLASTLGKK